MKRFTDTYAFPRHQMFTLSDGTFVVQWEEHRVQDILTGEYLDFDEREDYGRAIADQELVQLQSAGRIDRFNRHFVWLYPLPESGRFQQHRVLGRGDRMRAFYLITEYGKSHLEDVRDIIQELSLEKLFTVRLRDDQVVILSQYGLPFKDAQHAEDAQRVLQERSPDVFETLTLAFIEVSRRTANYRSMMENENASLNLDDIIASQSDTSPIAGKLVVLAVLQQDEREAFSNLLAEMQLEVKVASSASESLQLLEDYPAQLLIMDIQQEDMHAWPMISKIREISHLRDLPIIVITDNPNMGMTVAKVDYLTRPVSIARLRHNIWMALRGDAGKVGNSTG